MINNYRYPGVILQNRDHGAIEGLVTRISGYRHGKQEQHTAVKHRIGGQDKVTALHSRWSAEHKALSVTLMVLLL